MDRVTVVHGGTWDERVVEAELGVLPLKVAPVDWPVMMVDGIVEWDATGWLRYVAERTAGAFRTKTARSYSESLRVFVSFLLGRNVSLRGATRSHIVEYVNYRTVADGRVSGAAWERDRTVIKQFYEWLRETHHVPMPITVEHVNSPWGRCTSMREGRGIPKSSAAGTPLEPPQLRALMATAWMHGVSGASNGTLTGPRDAAFIALGAACGARLDTLVHLTVYELPAEGSKGDLVEMRLPAAISKSRREVRLPAFKNHLKHVHAYIRRGGSRDDAMKGWLPKNPIRISEPPRPGATGIRDETGAWHPFNTMTASDRRRLVTPEGYPALIFVSARNGAPISYATAATITADLAGHHRQRANDEDPPLPNVHTHDLRHTYATHLAALFYLGTPVGPGRDIQGRPHRIDVRSAVTMASTALGHVSESTTALYVQQVGMLALRYTVDDLLGRR
ncbi:site-specific integrase [Sinomonas atrocyanea]|uniref:tyrosine-type recombinase/integrase n=1 Tax=Sinomonas atrocyanea TaxID=37927 RepID=UPI00278B0499|nr:tyrosine-type recombinase/integrase [Sinomonas atrocyanea]MDQ0261027.1 site-specific recombinase XerD [Sinomonas atrocyanea]MDR6622018.1 site-specific recombinase XerD [Sinomonas atrocyanea]